MSEAHYHAITEKLLEQEREKVRVLREALEYAVNQVPEMGTVPGVKAALTTTAPEGGGV